MLLILVWNKFDSNTTLTDATLTFSWFESPQRYTKLLNGVLAKSNVGNISLLNLIDKTGIHWKISTKTVFHSPFKYKRTQRGTFPSRLETTSAITWAASNSTVHTVMIPCAHCIDSAKEANFSHFQSLSQPACLPARVLDAFHRNTLSKCQK